MNKEFTDMIILAQKRIGIYPSTNLPITLWLKMDNDKIIYMQNNYNRYTIGNDLIPISINEYNPEILVDTKLNVKEKDVKKVFNFIKEKYNSLISWVDEKDMDYSIMEYVSINRFKTTIIDGFTVTCLSHKDFPNLPVDLYVYSNGIKYQDERNPYTLLMVNNYNKTGSIRDCVTVSIEEREPKLVYEVKLGISKKEFRRVQDFIKRYYVILSCYIENKCTDKELLECIYEREEIDGWNIGITKDNYYVYLITEEYEEIPHFHYVDMETKGKIFSACIKLDKAGYFKHFLWKKNDVLTTEQKKNLMEMLKSQKKEFQKKISAWEFMVMTWIMNYENSNLDEEKPMPNYMDLK